MFVDLEAIAHLYFAAWAVDDSPQELAKAVFMAKGYASTLLKLA